MSSISNSKPSGRLNWMWAILPINAAFVVYNTALPLYVLSLDGNVLQIANVFAVFSLVSIPASIIWGGTTDRYNRRAFYFALSFFGCGLTFLAMFFLRDVTLLYLLAALLAFVYAASGPVSNLLTMETSERRYWYNSFGRLFFIANLGSALGLLVGLAWPGSLPVGYLLLFSGGSSFVSVLLTYRFVEEPTDVHRATVGDSLVRPGLRAELVSRVRLAYTTVAQKVLTKEGLRRISRTLRVGVIHAKTLLFFSSLLYMVGWAILNMSYVAFLSSYGLSNNSIFAITLSNMLLQLGTYALMSRFAPRLGRFKMATYGISLTIASYALIGLTAILIGHSVPFLLLLANLPLFSASGAGFAVWNGSASLTLFSSLGTEGRGGILGGYDALLGLGTVVGSLASGVISFFIGYSVTFLGSGGVLVLSLLILRQCLRLMAHGEERSP